MGDSVRDVKKVPKETILVHPSSFSEQQGLYHIMGFFFHISFAEDLNV